ncbi:hypothetical protein FACS1894217_10200 [Clostridia bacterium]|nr:hypothetical protein FACS1894217_10200 [Clostridia bacterium]
MTTIYWIRHGEAEGNLYRRCHGHYNSKITLNGQRQLSALRDRFANVQIDAVYSSDLCRAWTTADALARPRGQVVTVHPGLREVNLGEWEDLTWGEICHRAPKQYAKFLETPWEVKPRGGETLKMARIRAYVALRDIAARHDGQTVAIVSHGLVTRGLMSYVQKLSPQRLLAHGDNTCVTLLGYADGEFRLRYYADNSHLGELSTQARNGNVLKNGEMRFRPVSLRRELHLFERFRRDAWHCIYGNLENYDPEVFVQEARWLSSVDRNTVLFATRGDMPVGLLEVERESPLVYGAAHISFIYLSPEYRGRGLACQLLGQAVSYCRAKGRAELTLRVFGGNERGIKFYSRHGFQTFGEENALGGDLLRMSADITVPPIRPAYPWR